MKIVIIEDELPAARRLQSLLESVVQPLDVVTVLDSISSAIDWFSKHTGFELIFCDIHLADGLSFKIFEQIHIACPIIFTTAYDEYALKAFELNSVDYLLKPIDPQKLAKSVEKFKQWKIGAPEGDMYTSLYQVVQTLQAGKKSYKQRFLVKLGDKLIPVAVDQIKYMVAEDKLVFLVTDNQKKYPLDFTLDQLESLLDPAVFFRLNRQYTAHIQSIEKATLHLNGKLKVFLKEMPANEEIYVSREKAAAFKSWLGQELS